MISRRTTFLFLCGTAVILLLITVHLFARYHLNRAHLSHPLTLNIQDVTLRRALEAAFPGKEIVFETDEWKKHPLTIRVVEKSSVYVVEWLGKVTDSLIYRRDERIVVTRKSCWYSFFFEIDRFFFNVFGHYLWTSHGKP